MKLEHSLTELKIVKHFARTAPPPRQKKWIDYDERLQKVVENFDDHTILRYLKVVGSLILFKEKCFYEICSILIIQYLPINSFNINFYFQDKFVGI